MGDKAICAIPNCGKVRHGSTWCQAHYRRNLRYGDPLGAAPKPQKAILDCSIDGCGKKAWLRGWCTTHYSRWQRHGSPLAKVRPTETIKFLHDVAANFDGADCLIWPFGKTKEGYGKVSRRGAHRVVCEIAHGKAPSDAHQAAHICGNPSCVNPSHIRWATPAENAADKAMHGTVLRGSRHPNSRLTESQVLQIRERAESSTHKELSAEFGVCQTSIYNILSAKNWTHIG